MQEFHNDDVVLDIHDRPSAGHWVGLSITDLSRNQSKYRSSKFGVRNLGLLNGNQRKNPRLLRQQLRLYRGDEIINEK